MNILLTGAYKYSRHQLGEIELLGYNVDVLMDEKEICTRPGKYEAVICNSLFMHSDILAFSKLGFIQLTSAGLDRVPLEIIKSMGIKLSNARGIYSIPMSEWVVLKILEIYKHTRHFEKAQEQRAWLKDRSIAEVYGKTVGILGTGSVGQEIAKRLDAFSARVIGFDVYEPKCDYIAEYYPITSLKERIGDCDIIILSLPLTSETYHIIDAEILKLMKENSVLINISRGAVVDDKALLNHLQQGRFHGVALDVFEEEPLSKEHPLWQYDRVIITPHNSFISDNISNRMFSLIKENLKRFSDGDEPINSITL